MTKPLTITLAIATHNRSDLVARTLESIAQVRPCSDASLDVLVVANACTDDTLEVVKSWAARLPFPIRGIAEERVGLGHARNRAVREATGEVVALADDDIWMAPGWLEAAADAYLRLGADIVAGHIELWWEAVAKPAWMTPSFELVLSKLELGDHPIELKTPDVIGANFSFRKRVFEKSGPFRTDLGRIGGQLLAGEETFLVRCALEDGFRLFYIPGASVKHWVSPHRVQEKYMRGVNTGMAMTLAMLKPKLGPAAAISSLSIGAARQAYHGAAMRLARARGDSDAAMGHMIWAAVGRGRVLGTIARLRRGPMQRPRADGSS